MARVLQHKSAECRGCTQKYKKVARFEVDNPTWEGLAADWGTPAVMTKAVRNDKSVLEAFGNDNGLQQFELQTTAR